MRLEYSPASPDDWPNAIAVTATDVGEDDGIEEGETRFYEPNWKHRVAGNTIREQREKMKEAERRAGAALDALEKSVHCNNEVVWNNGICTGAECEYFASEGDSTRCLVEEAVTALGVQAPSPTGHRITSERIRQLMILVKSLWVPLTPGQREWLEVRFEETFGYSPTERMRELGIEVPYEVEH